MYAVAEEKAFTKKISYKKTARTNFVKNRNTIKVARAIELANIVNSSKPFAANPEIAMQKDNDYYEAFSQSGIELR